MNCLVSFDTKQCYFQETLKKKPCLLGETKTGLYIFKDSRQNANANAAQDFCTQAAFDFVLYKEKVWHLRMGHLSINRLRFLFPEINESLVKPHMFCTICPLVKQTRSVYPKSVCKS